MMNNTETKQVLGALTDHDLRKTKAAIALCEASLARVVEPVAWGAFYFGGKSYGQLYNHCKTEAQINEYIHLVHQINDDITLTKAPLYATPQAAVQPSQAVEVSDEEITHIAKTACAEGRLLWTGFSRGADGRYTVPVLSPSHFKLVREVIAAINAKGTNHA